MHANGARGGKEKKNGERGKGRGGEKKKEKKKGGKGEERSAEQGRRPAGSCAGRGAARPGGTGERSCAAFWRGIYRAGGPRVLGVREPPALAARGRHVIGGGGPPAHLPPPSPAPPLCKLLRRVLARGAVSSRGSRISPLHPRAGTPLSFILSFRVPILEQSLRVRGAPRADATAGGCEGCASRRAAAQRGRSAVTHAARPPPPHPRIECSPSPRGPTSVPHAGSVPRPSLCNFSWGREKAGGCAERRKKERRRKMGSSSSQDPKSFALSRLEPAGICPRHAPCGDGAGPGRRCGDAERRARTHTPEAVSLPPAAPPEPRVSPTARCAPGSPVLPQGAPARPPARCRPAAAPTDAASPCGLQCVPHWGLWHPVGLCPG